MDGLQEVAISRLYHAKRLSNDTPLKSNGFFIFSSIYWLGLLS